MTIEKITAKFSTYWEESNKTLACRIQGLFNQSSVAQWQTELFETGTRIPANSKFSFLLDERGYEYVDNEVHNFKREIVPRFLAGFGLYLSILPESNIQSLKQSMEQDPHNRVCIAMAMVHPNESVMQDLQRMSDDNEYYCSDINCARYWLKQFSNQP